MQLVMLRLMKKINLSKIIVEIKIEINLEILNLEAEILKGIVIVEEIPIEKGVDKLINTWFSSICFF